MVGSPKISPFPFPEEGRDPATLLLPYFPPLSFRSRNKERDHRSTPYFAPASPFFFLKLIDKNLFSFEKRSSDDRGYPRSISPFSSKIGVSKRTRAPAFPFFYLAGRRSQFFSPPPLPSLFFFRAETSYWAFASTARSGLAVLFRFPFSFPSTD